MGFVKTKEEISRIQEIIKAPRFVNAEMLQIEFLTTPETIQNLLPPGLEPTEEPLMVAMVGRWQSNCVADYDGGALYVAARHGDIEATYVLAMHMSTDAAIIYGREVLGEPKKYAEMDIRKRGNRMSGWLGKDGVRLIEIEADLHTDLGPAQETGANFNVKALPATDGNGLEHDAVLTLAEFNLDLSVNREGTGSLILRGTPQDPFDEIEVVSVNRATYVEGDLIAKARSLATIPAEDFLPYFYARAYDWSLLDTEEVLSAS